MSTETIDPSNEKSKFLAPIKRTMSNCSGFHRYGCHNSFTDRQGRRARVLITRIEGRLDENKHPEKKTITSLKTTLKLMDEAEKKKFNKYKTEIQH